MILSVKRIVTVFVIAIISSQTYAQSNSSEAFINIVKSSRAYYQDLDQPYELLLDFRLYQTHDSDKLSQHYKGVTLFNGDRSYTKIAQTEVLNVAGDYIKVNHDQKVLLYGKTSQKDISDFQTSLMDFEQYLAFFDAVQVVSSSEEIICDLKPVDISQVPFALVKLRFNKDYSVKKYEFYFTSLYPITNDDGSLEYKTPRLEIDVNSHQQSQKGERLFDISNFIKKQSNGQLILSDKFTDYQLINTTSK